MSRSTELTEVLLTRLAQLAPDLPPPVREWRFDPVRRWRFDLAWVDQRVAVECDGGVYAGGRHTRPAGFTADCHKLNAAAMAGWLVLRFTGGMLESDPAACVDQLRAALTARLRQ